MTPDMNAALGEQLLPRIVDLAAEQDPDREYACIARDFDMSKGIVKVTMARLANAVNGVAHWIDTSLRLPTPFSTIAYLGVPDIRYTFIVLAAVKCGHKVSDARISCRAQLQITSSSRGALALAQEHLRDQC